MLRLFRGPKIKRIAQGNPLKFFTRGNSANDSEKYRPASLGANAERRVYLCLTIIYYQTFRRLSNDFTELFEKRKRNFVKERKKRTLRRTRDPLFAFRSKNFFGIVLFFYEREEIRFRHRADIPLSAAAN